MCLAVATASVTQLLKKHCFFNSWTVGLVTATMFWILTSQVLFVQLDRTVYSKTPFVLWLYVVPSARRSATPPSQTPIPPPASPHHLWRSDLTLNIVCLGFFFLLSGSHRPATMSLCRSPALYQFWISWREGIPQQARIQGGRKGRTPPPLFLTWLCPVWAPHFTLEHRWHSLRPPPLFSNPRSAPAPSHVAGSILICERSLETLPLQSISCLSDAAIARMEKQGAYVQPRLLAWCV